MLTYEFFKKVNNELMYYYFPNGNKDAAGIVAISGNGKGRVVEESQEDFGRRYALHAINGIDTSLKEGTVAWY